MVLQDIDKSTLTLKLHACPPADGWLQQASWPRRGRCETSAPASSRVGGARAAARCRRRSSAALRTARSERMLLYALVQAHYMDFIARLEAQDRPLPAYVREEFDEYLRCCVLDHGFLRVVCEQCHAERLVAFSCKKRGLCPSCGARRMAESARHLVEGGAANARCGQAMPNSLPRPSHEGPIRAKSGDCATAAYPADCMERAFEFPICCVTDHPACQVGAIPCSDPH